eukprot:scaffold27601_cov20-Tisochrysis_lutea.AAC.1
MEMGSPINSGARTRSQANAGSRGGGCGSAMDVGSPIAPGMHTRNMSGSSKGGGGASAMDVASPAARPCRSGSSRDASPPRGSCSRGGNTWQRQQGQLPALLQGMLAVCTLSCMPSGRRPGRAEIRRPGSAEFQARCALAEKPTFRTSLPVKGLNEDVGPLVLLLRQHKYTHTFKHTSACLPASCAGCGAEPSAAGGGGGQALGRHPPPPQATGEQQRRQQRACRGGRQQRQH